MKRTFKILLTLAVLGLLATAPAALAARSSTAAAPCWKVLTQDWYDGQITGHYPLHCYQEAIDNAPADIQVYSSFVQDIKNARQAEIYRLKHPGAGGGTTGTTTTPGGASGGPSGPTGRKNPPGVSGALSASSADSVPIPLLVLAAIAVLLLAAGSAGFIARRLQARKVQLGPPAGTPQAPSQQ